MEEIEEILEENRRRLERIELGFDPLTGLRAPGERFECRCDGATLWLPVTMREFMSRPRSAAETDAERIRHDFPYWAATRAYIKNKEGGEDRLFHLNRAQCRLVTALEDMRVRGLPVRLILLKARQWGGSTCIQLYMAWMQLVLRTGLNSLIIAHQSAATDEIKDMFDRLVFGLRETVEDRYRLKLTMKGVGRSGAIFRIAERNAKVKVGTAERPDSCRGGDYSLVHLSEVAMWRKTAGKSPEDIQRSACSGVLLRAGTMIVLESTANGTGNFFHTEYEAAARGESQFQALFVPWYEIDQYSLPIANEREFARRLYEGRESHGASGSRRQPGAYLWWLWERGATLQAINWYISERSKYSDHGLMASEYPSDDVEAFVHSGARVFDKYRVEAMRPDCQEVPEIGELRAIADGGLPFVPGITDGDAQRAALRNVVFEPMASGSWKVWRHPGAENVADRYVVAVDVGGRGARSDWSVIVVFDRMAMTQGGPPEVVAQWRGHIDFDILGWYAVMTARYYRDALLVIESNSFDSRDPERHTDGDQSLFLLSRLRDVYDNLYARQTSPEAIARHEPVRYGFHTNVKTKPALITTLVQCVRDRLYVERDPQCLDEFLSYEQRANGSFGAIAGCHDDLLMTRAIGLYVCFNEMDAPYVRHEAGRNRTPRRTGYSFW